MLRPTAVAFAFLIASSSPAADIPKRLDELVRDYVDNKGFMGAVLVARNGRVLLSKGYGSANLEWNAPNTPATRLGIGSITKQFTAAAVLLLEERGKLRLDDPIAKYIDVPEPWREITFFHLLTHTAGFPRDAASEGDWPPRSVPAKEQVARLRSAALGFPPGTKRSYSNAGYVVLAYLIETISGQSWGDFVRQNVLEPAGMAASGNTEAEIVARRADGYRREGETFVHAPFIHPSLYLGCGGLYSTVEDLLRWETALFGGKVVSHASLEKMITPFKEDYGLGLAVSSRHGHKQIWHTGAIPGFSSYLVYDPKEKLMVVVLSNVQQLTVTGVLATTLMSVAHGETVILTSDRKAIDVSPETLARYVGAYEWVMPTFTGIRTVALEGDHLVSWAAVGANKGPVSRLFAESETSFFLKDFDLQIQFFMEGDRATRLVVTEGGPGVEHKRVAAGPDAALATTPAASPAFPGYYRILARHSGKAVIVQNASTANGADIVQRAADDAKSNGEWTFTAVADGYYLIAARHDGKQMVVQAASTAEDADIFQWGTSTGPNSQWQVVESGDGYYRLVNRRSGKVAQVAGAGTAQNADIVQATWNGGAHQQFQIVAVP